MEQSHPEEQPEKEQRPQRGDMTPRSRSYQGLIEERIAAAQAEGLFDNLAGAGQPLELDDDTMVPAEERAAYRLLKNAGYGLPWMELRKTIEEERQKLEAWHRREAARYPTLSPANQAKVSTELEYKIREINKLISSYNFMIPPAIGQLPLLRVEGYKL